MKIGVDLDHTVLGFPEFFRAMIPVMVAAGHTFHCTSGRAYEDWALYRVRLRAVGIDPDMIDHSLLLPRKEKRTRRTKPNMADQLDLVFDDDADAFQARTQTPIFKTPRIRAADRVSTPHPADK